MLHVNGLLVNGSLQCLCSEVAANLPYSDNSLRFSSLTDLFDVLLSKGLHLTKWRSIVIAITQAEELRKFSVTFLVDLFNSLRQVCVFF